MRKRLVVCILVAAAITVLLTACANQSPSETVAHAGKYTISYPSEWGEMETESSGKLLGETTRVYFVQPTDDSMIAFGDLTTKGVKVADALTTSRPLNANGETTNIVSGDMAGFKTWWDQGTNRVIIAYLADNAKVTGVIAAVVPTSDTNTLDQVDEVIASLRYEE